MDRHNLKYIISFLLLILFIEGCSESIDTSGCPYPDSCNYNPDGTNEDSCWYPLGGCLCEDGEDAISDCAGECGGSAVEDCAGECNGSLEFDECGVCGGFGTEIIDLSDIPTSSMKFVARASMLPWGNSNIDYVTDFENYFGFSSEASDDYDSMDILDPPIFDTNWIKVYFNHPEWESSFLDGDNFTQDFQSNTFCEFKEWKLIVESNNPGPLSLNIYPDFGGGGENYTLYWTYLCNQYDCEMQVIWDDQIQYLGTGDGSNIYIESYLNQNVPKEFLIKLSFD